MRWEQIGSVTIIVSVDDVNEFLHSAGSFVAWAGDEGRKMETLFLLDVFEEEGEDEEDLNCPVNHRFFVAMTSPSLCHLSNVDQLLESR